MRAFLCACDISVRVGVHFWDVQLRAACGAPAARRATDTSDLRASRRTCDVRVNERCKRHTEHDSLSTSHLPVDSAHMHTLDPHAVHLRRLPYFVPFRAPAGVQSHLTDTLCSLHSRPGKPTALMAALIFCSSFCSRGGCFPVYSRSVCVEGLSVSYLWSKR